MSPHKQTAEQDLQVDCAWCGEWFKSVLDLLSHVELDHLDPPAVGPEFAPA